MSDDMEIIRGALSRHQTFTHEEGQGTRPLTKSFTDLVQSRVARDLNFAAAFLREGVETTLNRDVNTGRAIPRDHIKATVGDLFDPEQWRTVK